MGGKATVAGRGRKPKPTARKIAAGNLGGPPLSDAEPDFGLITDIDAREWITGEARDMWRRITSLLSGQKVLQSTNLHNVEAFCVAYVKWRAFGKHVLENGLVILGATGGPIKNPALTSLAEAAKQMVTFGSMLGLDPASRQRLIGGGNKKPDNPFAGLLDG